MRLSDCRSPKWILLLSCVAAFFCFGEVNQLAQTGPQVPARAGDVNDFAGVVDEETRLQLATWLQNVREKTGIDFAVVTVESTAGQDIFGFSRELSRNWDVGARTSVGKSLLLVLAIREKESFTQFSRSVQGDLPEAVLGEMGLRMRPFVNAGQFGRGLSAGVKYFVNSMAQKLALRPEDFEIAPGAASTATTAPRPEDSRPPVTITASTEITGATNNPSTPPRPAEESRPIATEPATSKISRPRVVAPVPVAPVTRKEKAPTSVNQLTAAEEAEADADESEQVELTLTLPLAARITKLKGFLVEFPDSKSKGRAIELLISSYAALGDQKLKQGDSAGGIDQLMLAIAEAPIAVSDELYTGVISKIPANLFLRGERVAAMQAAQSIETKFGSDAKRLLALSSFYVGIEEAGEATRITTQAVNLAPQMAEAHQALALAHHISLRLEEAATEYKRALELDPSSKPARRGLADLSRAAGKAEDALALYRQQLVAEPGDKTARAGLVLSLLDLGRTAEAKTELEAALKADPRNLPLLVGLAYWYAAHHESEKAIEHGLKALEIEPRYTWSHIAMARAMIAQQKPLQAERALRFGRQYGKFPTLDYELASVLANAGLFEEAVEALLPSFTITGNQIEARLAGRSVARGTTFIELLAPERRASIFQHTAADNHENARILKDLLKFTVTIDRAKNRGAISEDAAIAAAREFAAGNDNARVYRQLYAASRLLQKGFGYQAAYDLAAAARSSADAGLNVPAVTVAVQADELREIRSRSIALGGTPDIPDAPRNVLSNLLRGRIDGLLGWSLFNQDKFEEAIEHLKRAANILPEGTPAWRTSLWHLGVALDRVDRREEALANYIKSYNAGDPDAVRRPMIERLYRRINGSVAGLDELIGPPVGMTPVSAPLPSSTDNAPAPAVSSSRNIPPSAPDVSPVKESPPAAEVSTPSGAPTPEASASPLPPPAETTAAPKPAPERRRSSFDPRPDGPLRPVETTPKTRSTVTILGQVRDAQNNPLANVVVVLISPQGTVLAATTNDRGIYSFTVASSTQSYRLIPSKDGYTFGPVDRLLNSVVEDQKEMNFVGTTTAVP